jgi:formimidoylglutamate deiminase
VWCESALLADGWARGARLTLSDGRIARIDTDVSAGEAAFDWARPMPGLANVHSHAFQRAMAGLAEARGETGDNFWTWREVMYRFLGRLGPDDVQTIAAMAQIEMLEGGFTRVGEFHYLHHDPSGGAYDNPAEMAARIAAAAEETGIGLTLLPVFYAHSNFGGAPPTDGQKRFIHDVDGFARLVDNCRQIVSELARRGGRDRAPQPARGDRRGADRHPAAGRRRPDPHPRRRADQGGRRLPGRHGSAAGALADEPCRRSTSAGA